MKTWINAILKVLLLIVFAIVSYGTINAVIYCQP